MKQPRKKLVKTSDEITIEELLTGSFSRTSVKRFGLRWLRIEIAEGEAGLDQVRRDLVRTEQWKELVLRALAVHDDDRLKLADRWGGAIKVRIAALEMWSQLIGALIAYLAGGCALLSIIGDQNPVLKTGFIVIGIVIGLIGGLFRFYIDRHAGSNRFVLACLEAAAKAAPPGSPSTADVSVVTTSG